MSTAVQFTSAEEQAKQLEESLVFIRQQEALMRKCLESKAKLLDAIKHASTLLAELRTSTLSPKQYYELYIAVFDALSYLGAYLKDDHANHHLADIYELVQYAGNIVPRLYLMITVGTVYMSIPEAPVKEIMKDMMEMCRGVQHPIRGLFLRYYLSQGCRDYLPVGTSDGPEGNLQDSIQFIITNFIEMNKLWVRLQHQGHSREREKRMRERQELQILVGSNLVRLSQLEGIDKDYYRESILPSILEQVIQCRDVIAQEYLLDVICQVFPDEFHLYTLDLFLKATTNLNPQVSVKKIILTLVSRLADYANRVEETGELSSAMSKTMLEPKAEDDSEETEEADEEEPKEIGEDKAEAKVEDKTEDKATGIPEGIDLFDVFWKYMQSLAESRPDMPAQDVTALLGGIVRLSLSCYPDNVENIDRLLEFATKTTKETKATVAPGEGLSKEAADNVMDLLISLINFYPKLSTVLAIPNYLPLLSFQPVYTQKAISMAVLNSILKNNIKIESIEDANGIFGLLIIIIKEGTGSTTNTGEVVPGGISTGVKATELAEDSEDVIKDQSKLAMIIRLLYNQDPDTHAKLLSTARKALSEGGDRIKYTYPALVTSALKLIRRYKARENKDSEWAEKAGSTFKFIQMLVDELNKVGKTELALRLYVTAASIADQVKAEEASYEFYAQAFSIYEESISDSRAQYQAICIIARTLQNSRHFSSENYDTLVSKCALYGSKLLKKPDQCRAVYLVSHLWWATEIASRGEDLEESKGELFKDDKRVLECLQRALRVADACMDVAVSVELFVEILNRYIYYFDRGNSAITVKYINGLIDLIQTNLNNNADNGISDSPRKHFERTLEYITSQKDVDEKFNEIVW